MLFIILAYYGIFNLICNKLKSTNFLRYFFAILPTILLTLASVYLNITKTNLLLFTYAFYLGCFTAKFPIIERLSNKQSVYAISLLSFFTFSTHWNFAGNRIDDIYKIVVSTFAFITLLNLCQKFNFNTKVKKTLQLFGTQSLAIYILQFRLCNFGNEIPIYIHNMNPFVLFLLTLIIAIPISYICCIVTKIIYTNSFLSFSYLGKRVSL